MTKIVTTNLTISEKKEVINLIEKWQSSGKLYSKRDSHSVIPSSVMKPIIDAALLTNEQNQVNYALDLIQSLKHVNEVGIPKGAVEDMHLVINEICEDKDIKQLTYQQFMYFLYWLQKVISIKRQ